ncbi:hypothetical protein WR25_16633 [Diploscapter pachys]|uniref:Uncharacterized protein n=1 Tax=Diploscapter pachys TaxID=2018661 RepID=A0A2A2KG45_9BILA|nr:hypothetical protein WR25_16633 [Diploscapter pachys]
MRRQPIAHAHERAGAARRLLAIGVDQPRIGDVDAALAADPAPFGDDRPRLHRPGKQQVERRRQQEPVGDEAVRRIESGVVQHLEIASAMRGAGRMIMFGPDQEVDARDARRNNFQP